MCFATWKLEKETRLEIVTYMAGGNGSAVASGDGRGEVAAGANGLADERHFGEGEVEIGGRPRKRVLALVLSCQNVVVKGCCSMADQLGWGLNGNMRGP